MTPRVYLRLGIAVPLLLALPALRHRLEADMFTHMLVQFPLLIAAGICLGLGLPHTWQQRLSTWNRHGISGLISAWCVSSFWMVPLALDLVLVDPWLETAKFASLVLGVGTALALSWPRAGLIVRGFFLGNILPMLAVVGWLYLEAPIRLCNAYLTSQQENTGSTLIWLSVLGACTWIFGFFLSPASRQPPSHISEQYEENNYRFHSPL